METTLNLTLAYRFTNRANLTILCTLFATSCYSFPFEPLNFLLYIVIFSIFFTLVLCSQNADFQYIILNEGRSGNCIGCNESVSDNSKFVLNEAQCRVSILGCWLIFLPKMTSNRPQFWSWFTRHHISVFVPKHCLSLSDYKKLCRHLIWHSE